MKCIIPLARGGGYDKDTNNTPYLISIAGKPLIGHLIDQLLPVNPEEIVFILGDEDKSLIDYITSSYDFKTRFIMQKQNKGSAHAIYGAKDVVAGETIILFGDTFFTTDFKKVLSSDADGIIWTKDVVDPTHLGVVLLNNGVVSKLIEKPDEPITTLAMIGLYYVKEVEKLFAAIDYLLRHKIAKKGLYHLTDALQIMIDNGASLVANPAVNWIDADHGNGIFELNTLLVKQQNRSFGKTFNSVIIKPVHIGKGAVIKNSVVGPNVTIGVGSMVEQSIIRESILCTGVEVKDTSLEHAVLATGAMVLGKPRKLSLDSNARFEFE